MMVTILGMVTLLGGSSVLSLVPTRMFPTCLTNPLDLVPDPEDCHIFYQCDLNPQPMSCGDMMFNSYRQVCDWPSTVVQVRPECRELEQLRFSTQDYFPHRQRTLRMLRLFGDGDKFSQKRLRAPQDVGLGRRKDFGNREYFGGEEDNRIESDYEDNYSDYQYEEYGEDVDSGEYEEQGRDYEEEELDYASHYGQRENDATEKIPDNKGLVDIDRRVIYQIEKKISEAVEKSINDVQDLADPQFHQGQAVSEPQDHHVQDLGDHQVHHVQAVSDPADTTRLHHGYPSPRPSPIVVEDTREYKPVWTVTRERPQQTPLKMRMKKKYQEVNCDGRNCQKKTHRVLRKIKRRLIEEEREALEERRNDLNKKEEVDEVRRFDNGEDDRALTLKEAYDRAVWKVEKVEAEDGKDVEGNLLSQILNRDFGDYSPHNYVSSDILRQ